MPAPGYNNFPPRLPNLFFINRCTIRQNYNLSVWQCSLTQHKPDNIQCHFLFGFSKCYFSKGFTPNLCKYIMSDHHKLLVTCLTLDCPPHHAFQSVQQLIMLNRMEDERSLVADSTATTRPLLQNGPAFRLHCQFRCSVSRKFKVVPQVTAGKRLEKMFLIHVYYVLRLML